LPDIDNPPRASSRLMSRDTIEREFAYPMMGEDIYNPPTPRSIRHDSTATSVSEESSIVRNLMMPTAQGTPSSEGSRPRVTVRRSGEPPRNADDQIYCDHPSCATDPPTFRRPCEWNKHMDKHDRPYKCSEPGCDKVQGFTYSGGLLRHQREVHKLNVPNKKAFFCPYPNCNRYSGTGNGFTRKENLNEHIRRRHIGESSGDAALSPTIPKRTRTLSEIAEDVADPIRKRRRTLESELAVEDNDYGDGSDSEDFRTENKRLRYEMEQKDGKIATLESRLQQLESTLAQMQQMLQVSTTTKLART